jgi:hypothetical protein
MKPLSGLAMQRNNNIRQLSMLDILNM